ncbi:unnamed protein product [Rotaria magnacalcarata]|uniref:Alpha/beta hydrolase fold-3 domain-containing protein n=3 Tax=Rotaria magnacalcarata TaxID=392030 RepID=A0A814DPS3_9BILA|nr:unnamed protein product [Rotaria magnacalcarata]
MYANGTCNCVVSNDCQEPMRIGPPDIVLPGLFVGCFPSDGLKISTLECFYSSSCINTILSYLEYYTLPDKSLPTNFSLPRVLTLIVNPLNESIPSHFSTTTSIGTIINELFIEERKNISSYESYYVACAPTTCNYDYSERRGILSAKTICSAAIGYRLEPAHKYPVWLDNAADVTQHVIEDNAGAMTAASLSHTLKNIDFQVLVSPALDTLGETPSYEEFASPMYYVTPEFMECRDDVKDPRVSILRNTTFEGLPETLLLVIEFDFLRNGNLEYHKLLEKAGDQTKLVVLKDVVHIVFRAFLKACAEAMSSARDFMASI